jgi:multidrug efflux pump subunit AcrA (membrane-fusion protein)
MIETEPRTPPSAPLPPPAVKPEAAPRPRARRRRVILAVLASLAVLLGLLATLRFSPWPTAAPPPAAETPVAPKLVAGGQVRPVAQARVGALTGGVLTQLAVEIGDLVGEQQEIGRVRGPNGQIEIITAPWRGTVTSIPVHVGDTITPGTTIATLGDLSRLQVETTDVDEFIIGYVYRGQPVTVSIDALDRRELAGYVRSVALEVVTDERGDEHYPVIIDLVGPTTALRPGMSVRVFFPLETP